MDADDWKRLKPEKIKLPAADYEAFMRRLNDPPKPNAKLRELMRRKPVWDQK